MRVEGKKTLNHLSVIYESAWFWFRRRDIAASGSGRLNYLLCKFEMCIQTSALAGIKCLTTIHSQDVLSGEMGCTLSIDHIRACLCLCFGVLADQYLEWKRIRHAGDGKHRQATLE